MSTEKKPCPESPRRRTVDVQPGDYDFLEKFIEDVDSLCGLTEEAFEEHPSYLLSPVLRKLIRDKGRETKTRLSKIRHHLAVDNLGPSFS